ncbi:MAG: family 10 glycosylhydrolase [bacterium]|jgi:uncharacterized lipoprotein YddW (UPF0748 family)
MKWMIHLIVLAGLLAGILPGAAISGSPEAGPMEVRAAWVTRWAFKSPEDVAGILGDLHALGINTVFFQVRGACDVLYDSPYEPWSRLLTGEFGKDPGWDPLAVAIEEARKRKMELHAWINVFPAWPVTDTEVLPPRTEPLHVYHAHREWLARDVTGAPMSRKKGESRFAYVFLSPSNEEVQAYLEKIVTDLVGRYQVDGLHLDYIRYPDSTYSYDPDSRALYRMQLMEAGITEEDYPYSDWRRQNLTDFVGRLGAAARKARSGVTVSAAVWQRIDAGKNEYFQDGVEWVKQGHVDFVAPMIYTTSADLFEKRLASYVDLVGAGKVLAGLGPYLEGFTDSLVAEELSITAGKQALGFSIFNSDYAVKYADVIRPYSDASR